MGLLPPVYLYTYMLYMYAHMYMYLYVYVSACMCTMRVHMYLYIHVNVTVYVPVHGYAHVYAHIYVFTRTYISRGIYMYISIYHCYGLGKITSPWESCKTSHNSPFVHGLRRRLRRWSNLKRYAAPFAACQGHIGDSMGP